jgi:hypothetical protein
MAAIETTIGTSMVEDTCNPTTFETEAGVLKVLGQPRIHSKTLLGREKGKEGKREGDKTACLNFSLRSVVVFNIQAFPVLCQIHSSGFDIFNGKINIIFKFPFLIAHYYV